MYLGGVKILDTKYSKALRYAASRCMDLGDTRMQKEFHWYAQMCTKLIQMESFEESLLLLQ